MCQVFWERLRILLKMLNLGYLLHHTDRWPLHGVSLRTKYCLILFPKMYLLLFILILFLEKDELTFEISIWCSPLQNLTYYVDLGWVRVQLEITDYTLHLVASKTNCLFLKELGSSLNILHIGKDLIILISKFQVDISLWGRLMILSGLIDVRG